MNNIKTILFTKNIPQTQVEQMAQLGLHAHRVDFLNIELQSIPSFHVTPNSAFIFTSTNGAKGYAQWANNAMFKPNNTHIGFSISGNTLEWVRGMGFVTTYATADSQSLANKIIEVHTTDPFTHCYYFTCKDRLPFLEETLHQHSISLQVKEVYQKELMGKKVEVEYDAIVFYSPSQIKGFLLQNMPLFKIPVFCIGNTTGKEAAHAGFENIFIATQPTTESIVELIKQKI